MNNTQREVLAIAATVVTIGVISYAAGKISGALSARMMTKKFNKAVDQNISK
jgi:hypothetical protein